MKRKQAIRTLPATLRRRWIVLAAIAAVPLALALPAGAQVKSNNDGHALDANNRVGSGGRNEATSSSYNNGVTGNDIVTGNVTGGKAFAGHIGYTDAEAFRGILPGSGIDRFIADSNGSPTRSMPNVSYTNSAQPFFGDSRGVAPPPGTVPLGWSGGFTTPPPNFNYSSSEFSHFAAPQLGTDMAAYGRYTQVIDQTRSVLPGDMIMAGLSDNSGQLLLTGSPLYGMHVWRVGDATDVYNLSKQLDINTASPSDRFRLNDSQIQQLQQELGQQDNNPANSNIPKSNLNVQPGRGNTPLTPNGLPNQIQPAPETPDNTALSSSTNNPLGGQSINGNGLNTGAGRVLPAGQLVQSPALIELHKRLAQYEPELMNQAGVQPATPGNLNQPRPGISTVPGTVLPGTVAQPNYGVRPPPGPTTRDSHPASLPSLVSPLNPPVRPAPLQIKSLADGVKTPGLAKLLESAEELTRQKQYTSALDAYDDADRVAPGDGLILLGRANALIGATTYARAESNLRSAIDADPSLLLAQYDLSNMIGEKRLEYVISDLKTLDTQNPKATNAPLLLAYITYCQGKTAAAKEYLDQVDSRLGHPDPLTQLMRKHWSLPANGGNGTTRPSDIKQ